MLLCACVDFRLWHITKFCCNAKFGRNQVKADMARTAVGSTRS
jgi:hypothetical protein